MIKDSAMDELRNKHIIGLKNIKKSHVQKILQILSRESPNNTVLVCRIFMAKSAI
jgi:DNA-directed RNA polymerase beta' subunit